MGVFKRLTNMIFSRARYWLWSIPNTKYSYSKEVGDGLRSSVIVAVLFWIMRRFSEAKMIVEKDDELEPDHELVELMRRPNEFYSGRSLRAAMSLSYNLDGNAYAIKIRNSQLKPVALWYVPHWMIEPHWPGDSNNNIFIDYYSYYVDGVEHKLDPEDVVHVRFGLDPKNTRKGMSPFKALLREIYTDDEAANFTASLLRNFGIPGLIISPDSDEYEMAEGTPDEIKAFFKTKFNRDRRGEPLIMRGKTKVEQFGFDPKSLDLGRLREIPEERVCAVLGVPAAVVGFGTGLQQTKVGATMKELRAAAYDDCIIPMQSTFGDELDVQLLNEFETERGYHIAWDMSDIKVLQEDENERAKRFIGLVEASMITVSEARQELGLEVKPEHEVYLQKINITRVPVTETIPEPTSSEPLSADGVEVIPTNGDGKNMKLYTMFVKQAWRQKLITELLKEWFRLTDVWVPELTKSFKKLGKGARSAWDQMVEDQGITAEMLRSQTPEQKQMSDDVYADLVSGAVPSEEYVGYERQYLRVGSATFDMVETITGLGVHLEDVNEARIAASGGTRRGLLDLTRQTKDAVAKAIAEGRALGEGPPGIAARIESQVAAGPWSTPEIRARVISRTETKYAQNISSIEAYKSIPSVTQIQVVDAQLGETDDFCMSIDGAIVSFEEAESLAIEEHPNGTRSFTPVVGERSHVTEGVEELV